MLRDSFIFIDVIQFVDYCQSEGCVIVSGVAHTQSP